jgi:hypothetical protein
VRVSEGVPAGLWPDVVEFGDLRVAGAVGEENAHLGDRLTAIRAELADERAAGTALRTAVGELSLELAQAKDELAAATGVRSLREPGGLA